MKNKQLLFDLTSAEADIKRLDGLRLETIEALKPPKKIKVKQDGREVEVFDRRLFGTTEREQAETRLADLENVLSRARARRDQLAADLAALEADLGPAKVKALIKEAEAMRAGRDKALARVLDLLPELAESAQAVIDFDQREQAALDQCGRGSNVSSFGKEVNVCLMIGKVITPLIYSVNQSLGLTVKPVTAKQPRRRPLAASPAEV